VKTAVLIIWLISGDAITIKQQPGVGCHEAFERITYSKNFKNQQGEKRIGTFYHGTEVLAYRCI
jgi:hypothetical protein